MERRQEALELIEKLLERDALRLRRSFGVGLLLYNKLRDLLPSSVLENLRSFDGMSLEKRKAILVELKKLLSAQRSKVRRIPQVEKRPLRSFFTDIGKLNLLDDKEKKLIKSLGINTVIDALFYFPLRYEDRRPLPSVKLAKVGDKVVLKLRVREVRILKDDRYTAEVVCTDGTEYISLLFKYKKTDFVRAVYRIGSEVFVLGKVKSFQGKKYIVHPQLLSEEERGSVLPIYYARTKGEVMKISSRTRQNRLRVALQKIARRLTPRLPDYMPRKVIEKYNFPPLDESVLEVHTPYDTDVKELNRFADPYHRRLIYDDLFLFQLSLLLKRKETEREKAPKITLSPEKFIAKFERSLPFPLTNAQRRVLKEVLTDMNKQHPMNRLLQGDVGSGKTIVAIGATLAAVEKGYQVAVMVPTEVLARQHHERFANFGMKVELLIGSLPQSQKKSARMRVREGEAKVVVGTHALIQDEVAFERLGLVIIDEQHRFGVLQRKVLLEKGGGYYPHCLVMSATPIPRTLALSLYGDLDISILDEMPPGRKEVKTILLYESEREELLKAVEEEVSRGNKIFVIYPLIEESDKMELRSAVEEHRKWKELFPNLSVLLLHGRLNEREKKKVMERFRQEGDILVSTTVIEVGVDIPQATLMVVEEAHRFGLSQLHQLRGRVGRSDRPSRCYLVVPDHLKRKDADAIKRLKVLLKTTDGFKVAEMDMKLRGPGELLGISQSGYFGFNVANLARSYDREILHRAREDALELLEEDPQLASYPDLKEMLMYRYGNRLDLSSVA